MKFPKDILVIDFEGMRAPKQIGAILLDKDTLAEKDSFVSYIHANLQGRSSVKSGITQEMLNGAPSQAEVGQEFFERFGSNVIIASFVAELDMKHLRTLTASRNGEEQYDYHVLDIWPIAYTHLLKTGYQGGMNSEDIFQAFGAKPRGSHDALEDCRIAADVLRKCVL
ncbi:MAG: hypothetical protein JWN89_401 [Parcubacteria group bacterium]|nr:hypothetical protein [Parcubacteria group bacterium]